MKLSTKANTSGYISLGLGVGVVGLGAALGLMGAQRWWLLDLAVGPFAVWSGVRAVRNGYRLRKVSGGTA